MTFIHLQILHPFHPERHTIITLFLFCVSMSLSALFVNSCRAMGTGSGAAPIANDSLPLAHSSRFHRRIISMTFLAMSAPQSLTFSASHSVKCPLCQYLICKNLQSLSYERSQSVICERPAESSVESGDASGRDWLSQSICDGCIGIGLKERCCSQRVCILSQAIEALGDIFSLTGRGKRHTRCRKDVTT